MAISAGDSVYVAAPILCDPAVQSKSHEVRRIIGNIGRAGLAFLMPPSNPRTKQIDLESYQVIDHHPYNGRLEDCFKSTILHLSFSGYEFVLDFGDHGTKNVEAFFLETLILAHDRGEWLTDIDTISTLSSPHLHRAATHLGECMHSQSDRSSLPDFPLVTIDRWEELLEKPTSTAVVGAHSNWLARSAAAAVSVKMGNKAVLLSSSHCWKCSERPPERGSETPSTQAQPLETNVVYIL